MYDITATICITSYALHMTSLPLFRTSHLFIYYIKSTVSDITSTISDLTSTLSVSSNQLYRWYHSHSMCAITPSIRVTSYQIYLYYHIHYVWHHNTVCSWDHTRHMYDMVCPTDDIISRLSHQTTIVMMSHPLQAWHRTHSIFVITNSPLISHPLLYDVTLILCVISYALCITLHPLLMSSHYCTYDNKTSIYETTSIMYGKIYTIHVTSQPLICVITATVLTSSNPLFEWHHTSHMYGIFCTIEDFTSSLYDIKPPFVWHPSHYIWYCIHAICVITSTLLMVSYQLDLRDLIRYISWHHDIISIACDITFAIFVTSQPQYLCHHTHTFGYITLFVCMTSLPLYV